MADPWALYDQMIGEIPEDVLVREVVVGAHHCYVDAECGCGVAALDRGGVRARLDPGWAGRPLRELAACARSWCFEVASVGVAALNAWHNRREAAERLGIVAEGADADPFGRLVPVVARMAAKKDDGSRPRVVVVGHFPRLGALAAHAEVLVLERAARADDDLPDTACEYVLPGADVTLMTGMTLANKTAPRLLELARRPLCCVVGPSATLSARVLDAGADLIAGSLVADRELARSSVAAGGSPRAAGALEHVLVAGPRGREALAR